ncbi:trans-sulfuration enzyme family protein [Nocardia sp. NPDC004711]
MEAPPPTNRRAQTDHRHRLSELAFESRIVHAGRRPEENLGAFVPAIHQAAVWERSALDADGEYEYSRSGNPTRTALEDALGAVEGGLATVFSTGMAAVQAAVSGLCQPGDNVVLSPGSYAGTVRLLVGEIQRWGLECRLVDFSHPEAVEAAVDERTRLLWVETPTNPLLEIVDLHRMALARQNALLVVDNTVATPIYQQPLDQGADIVLHSTAKYLGGHSDVMGGALIVRDPALDARIKWLQNAIGSVLGPFDCFLVHRGLRTLHARMPLHTRNARAVADYLVTDPRVSDVRYPGFSGLVSFRHTDPAILGHQTRVFTLATSFGGVESTFKVPTAMVAEVPKYVPAGMYDGLVRLSCGIESAADLVNDLRHALDAAEALTAVRS